MVEYKYDKITSVQIGRLSGAGANDNVTILNVLAFAYRIVTVEEGMVFPIAVINDWNPSGVHHSHKYYEMIMVLDTDWLTDVDDGATRWAYSQDVNANIGEKAIDEVGGENHNIKWFSVIIRDHTGLAPRTLIFANDVIGAVWCTGEKTEISNEDGTPHQTTTYTFIGLDELV